MNESDQESKYLVYASFPKPSDAENPLADMYYYSVPYYTDRVSQMSQELGIDNRFKEYLVQYNNFWKNKIRVEKFKGLGIDHFNVETIDIGLIAVLTDVKTPNFEEVIRKLLFADHETYMKALDDNGLSDRFWELCEKQFGYENKNPNMDDLAACMLLTYASVALKDTLPEVLQSYVLKKKNDVERIENMYSFTYLQKVTPKWNQELTDNLVADTGLKRQEDFYRNYLKGYEGKNRVIVIISDAFRYECAKELMERLELDEKCTPKLDCMISGLPSVTSVGMASLLPHKELLVDEKLNVTVDGQSSADLVSRDKILKAQNENNVALSFDEVAGATQEKVRELLQKKNIVYIYHNQVDARGDKPASENEVFKACSEAIEEIHKLIKKLTGYISAPKFFITADHGFLYKRDKLHEFDKVAYNREICAYSNKRFLITTEKVNEPGMKSRMMTYMSNLYVTTPNGADIFQVPGGGQNYVHGGSSLQEMLIPVIELTTNTRYVAYDYVNVILTSVNRKVTNLITYFDFIQTEKVTDTMKARSLVAYFTTEDGEKISFDVPIMANSREEAPEKRTFHEKFTLKSREYKYGDKYYLVLADANDEKNILEQYEFMIDIAFVDDFGF